jgi:cephalosporin hydroxylase
MNAIKEYIKARDEQVKKNMKDRLLKNPVSMVTSAMVATNYAKNFTWMGVPILQYPTDLMVMQELIWKIKPRYIIETGTAFGGTAIFFTSMLAAMGIPGTVISIDLKVKKENMIALEGTPTSARIQFIKGDSADPRIAKRIFNQTRKARASDLGIMVVLDSNHTHAHVLRELELYAPLVSVGSYVVVFDTAIEFFHHLDKNQDRPWSKGNNPWTAVQAYLSGEGDDVWCVDREVETRALITAAPGGWLRRVR